MSLDAGRVGVRADQVDIHGRVTSPSFLNELLEDLPEWTDMPVWVNGTEELLPSNNSVPVTSPILADIAYPDIRRDNQYFTYRESPTPVDGLAKIKSIKGNTLVWNQLVDTNTSSVTLTSGHKFITKVGGTYSLVNGTGQSLSVTGGTDEVFDLTKMRIDSITSADEFTSLFPFSYYQYDAGSLLSFNGTGIKTTGKNQLLKATQGWDANGLTNVVNEDGSITISGTATGTGGYVTGVLPLANIIPAGTVISIGFTTSLPSRIRIFAKNNPSFNPTYDVIANTSSITTTISADLYAVHIYLFTTAGESYDFTIYPQIEFGSTATTYEPYITSTTTIPTDTYFPTGMKSAGNVYDELTPTKAITRIGAVDLGTLNWTDIDSNLLQTNSLASLIKPSSVSSLLTPFHSAVEWSNMVSSTKAISVNANGIIRVKDTSFISASAFKTAMSGVYLYYELATPVELPTLSLGE